MEILSRLNALDLLIIGALAGGFFLGWTRGVIRQLLSIAAFYVALVIGAQYHRVVGGWVMSMGSGATWVIVDSIAFSVVFAVVLLLFNWLGYRVYTDTRIPFLKAFDNVAGALLGILTVLLELVFALSILRFMLSVNWLDWESLRQSLVGAMAGSGLEDVLSTAAPALFALIRPWLPAGLPAILSF